MIYNNNPFSLEPPPPKKLFSDFLSSLPTSPTPPPEPPPPQNILIQAIQELGRKSQKGAKAFQDAGTAQKEAWKKFLANPTAENSVDIVGDMALPLAGTTGRAFKSVAANPSSKDFLDNLYSRLSAAIVGGPGKAQGRQWLKHLEKSASKGEIDHTGLKEFLEDNMDRVFGKDEIQKFSQVNPVRLGEEVYEDGGGMYGSYWPKLPKSIKPNDMTYKEIVLTGNLPYSKEASAKQTDLKLLSETRDELARRLKELFDDFSFAATRELDAIANQIQQIDAELFKAKPLVQPAKHFAQLTNQIGHLRTMMGKRNGKKTLVLGEAQSDTHQAARTEGRLGKAGEALDSERQRLYERFKKADEELAAHNAAIKRGEPTTTQKDYELRRKWSDAEAAWKDYTQENAGSLPLPFQGDKEWSELLLKRALFEAAQNNADEVYIPPGKALTKAVGMPQGGQKFYDKDLPNQLVEYLNKQLGVKVQPEVLQEQTGGIPAFSRLMSILDPLLVGPNQIATADLPGPLPRYYKPFIDHVSAMSGPATPEKIDEAARWALEYARGLPNSLNIAQQVNADAFKVDAKLLADMYSTPITNVPEGSVIPLPPEAREKILTDGQRLWAAFLAAGLPSLLSQQKKDDSKRTRSKGS